MRKPGTLGLKKFGLGELCFKKVWAQNIFIDFLAESDYSEKIEMLTLTHLKIGLRFLFKIQLIYVSILFATF